MSANKLPPRACTAALCAALAIIFAGTASAQSLSYMPIDRDSAVLRQPVTQTEEPSGVPGGDELPAPLQRQIAYYPSNEPAGTIIIDTAHTFLYLTLGDGKAIRYGIGVGREGFTWSGIEAISRKSEWPDWIPPAEMIARQPYLPRWVGGGPGNPLGARALYLGNTAYRIHGTNDPRSIGKHVSSGCIRLRDADVIDLYDRVGIGAKVIVLPNDQPNAAINDGHSASSERGSRVVMAARTPAKPAVAIADRSPPHAGNTTSAPVGLY
jgi:lipoprotein-anchoring transpeptidase ErfK/SrfK